ncbi:MAG: hypothetical protein ACE362_23780 [Phaeodactylibacter xiamenensis]|uniref:hypothetical protein n=1 Tax=Phaeodactylibacter xiamenensis TaxID=1524460 RepID=UPI001269D18D|nr:hypothetical protein [Phaeodactylibacter xiamenensis]MCR9052558.1 hypothetical protein [bacterium]
MKTLRNIISLLSLAAVASSPVSGVLAPAHAGGCCVLKFFSSSCELDASPDALCWEPVLPDDGPCSAGLPKDMVFPPPVLAGSSSALAATVSYAVRLPFYLMNQSLLFYDPVSI